MQTNKIRGRLGSSSRYTEYCITIYKKRVSTKPGLDILENIWPKTEPVKAGSNLRLKRQPQSSAQRIWFKKESSDTWHACSCRRVLSFKLVFKTLNLSVMWLNICIIVVFSLPTYLDSQLACYNGTGKITGYLLIYQKQ